MNRNAPWTLLASLLLLVLLHSGVAVADVPSPGDCDSCAIVGPDTAGAGALGFACLTLVVLAVLRQLRS